MKNKESETTIPKERTMPFASLGKALNPEFVELCKKLLFLIRENGISQIKPDIKDREQLFKFVGYVHAGWKEAQSVIISRLIINLEKIDSYQKQIKVYRQSREKEKYEAIRKSINTLHTENTVMRRMIDSIAWNMLKGEHSTVRRLTVKGGHNNCSVKNIKDAISTIEIYNKTDHLMALSCDLTTFIHVGDIILFDYTTGKTIIVELKSGDKNLALAHAASFSLEAECPTFDSHMQDRLNDTDQKHFKRLKKQALTGKLVTDTLNNEKGTDHNTGGRITLHPTDHVRGFYSDKIVKCYNKINAEKTWAIDTIDECLHIGVYNNNKHAFVGFNVWMDRIKCNSRIYNITDSFRIPTSTPLASLDLPTDLLYQIIAGKIIVILCLDVRAFVNFANSMHPDLLTFADRKETAQADSGYFEILKLEDLGIKSKDAFIGQGLVDRIIFDMLSPKQIIDAHKHMIESQSNTY